MRMEVTAPPPIGRLLLDFNISSSSRSPSSASCSLRLGLAARGVPARARWARAVGVPASRKLQLLRAPRSAPRAPRSAPRAPRSSAPRSSAPRSALRAPRCGSRRCGRSGGGGGGS